MQQQLTLQKPVVRYVRALMLNKEIPRRENWRSSAFQAIRQSGRPHAMLL